MDRGLAGRRDVQALLIRAEGLDAQIREARVGLLERGPAPEPFTRCAECSSLLTALPHADARDLVPPYVWQTQAEFRRCSGCGRVYWKGTHWPSVQARLAAASPGEEGEES